MPQLDAPAQVIFWPERSGEQGQRHDTLREALAEVARRPDETAWIVTLSGKILRPGEIKELLDLLRRSKQHRMPLTPAA